MVRTGLIGLPDRPEQDRRRHQPHPEQHVEHAEERVGQQVLAEDRDPRGVEEEQHADDPQGDAEGHGVDDAGQPRRRGAAAGRGVVPGLAPGDHEHREGHGEGRHRAGDGQLGGEWKVLGAPDPVGEDANRSDVAAGLVHARRSADLELGDEQRGLVQLHLDDARLVDHDLVGRRAGLEFDDCSGVEWKCSSPAASASMSKVIGSPAVGLDPVAVGSDLSVLQGDLHDRAGRRRLRLRLRWAGLVGVSARLGGRLGRLARRVRRRRVVPGGVVPVAAAGRQSQHEHEGRDDGPLNQLDVVAKPTRGLGVAHG